MPVLSTVEAQLLFHKPSIVMEPQRHRNEKKQKKTAANYELAEFKNCKLWCYSTLCPINEFNDPVDMQNQLEFSSPPKPPGKHLLCYLAILTWWHR